jgi:hypothetical protein
MFLGSRVRPVRKADNLTAIYEPILTDPGLILRQRPVRVQLVQYLLTAEGGPM